ncbi:hypothetical protein [Rhodanobacter sp. L36]|uniref:hypothetical protein n=1 Tax=Rhodanobacter sp. L36 TaxID=1747221 RepID=UPI00131E19E8|nr:hypothetical protein [Rhodanobacter sp. L36]
MFTLQILCATIEDAERIIATLKYGVAPSVVSELADRADAPLLIENESTPRPGTLDAARAALKGLQQRHGADKMEVPLEVLGRFSAGRVGEVSPVDYEAFVAACEAA